MTAHQIAVDVLLGAGVAFVLLSCIGMMMMKDAFQRVHFVSPPATLGIGCIAAAVILEEGFTKTGAQASIKVLIVGGAFFLINAVLTHATARAARTREHGEWKPQPGEHIPIVNRPGKYVEVTEEEARERQKQRRAS